MYDLVIKNGTVIDGTGAEPFAADIAVKDGKIAKIAPSIDGGPILDASGLTVTPGFIDSHSHSDRAIVNYPDQREKIEQGITFSITGQCGGSAAPYVKDGSIYTISEFLRDAENIPQGSGSLVLAGHGTIRRAVIGTERRAPTAEELEQMKELLRDAIRGGALGMSLGLIYVPGCYADTDELIEMAKVCAECGGLVAAHIRSEKDALIEAVTEFITIIRASGARGVISHHKSCVKQNWGKVETTLGMIDEANAEGLDIYCDVYPYIASHTSLIAHILPSQFHPAGTKNAAALLDDPEIYARVKAWGDSTWHGDLSHIQITSCSGHPEYAGLRVDEIAKLRGSDDQLETCFDLIRESGNAVNACFFTMCEADVERVLAYPRAMICTDSDVARGSTSYHPRLRATFPRVLGRYVRKRGIVTLPEMIRKMTSLPAAVYELAGKGRIAEGFDADLCIFDAQTICDRADFKNCTAKNEGLHYVLVDGEVVVTDGVYNGKRRAKVCKR